MRRDLKSYAVRSLRRLVDIQQFVKSSQRAGIGHHRTTTDLHPVSNKTRIHFAVLSIDFFQPRS